MRYFCPPSKAREGVVREREWERDRGWEVEVAENSGKQLEYHKVQPWGEKTGEIFWNKRAVFSDEQETGEKQGKDRELNGGGEL